MEEIKMKICQNCSHENKESSKFCAECGAKLEDTPKFCPECGTGLDGISRFCPECGYNLASLQDNGSSKEDNYQNGYSDDDYHDVSLEDSFDNEYSNFDDDYESDEQDYGTSEEKIKNIVDKYIKTINKSNTAYTSGAVQNSEYSQVFQNVRTYIAKNVRQSDIYGFIDVTVFGKGKNGLVFTNDTLYLKEPGGSITLPYYIITDMYIKSNNLYFENSKGCGTGLLNFNEVYISGISYNLPALKDCLEEIQSVL